MHEFSLATEIAQSVREFAKAKKATRVLMVKLQLNELTCVEAGQLKLCYDSITRNSVLEGSTLDIELTRAMVHCSQCCYRGAPEYWADGLSAGAIPILQCPKCGQTTDAIRGHDCAIKSVHFVNAAVAVARDSS
jgi:hydrogenase nickel incorporation protein HypA/HybF